MGRRCANSHRSTGWDNWGHSCRAEEWEGEKRQTKLCLQLVIEECMLCALQKVYDLEEFLCHSLSHIEAGQYPRRDEQEVWASLRLGGGKDSLSIKPGPFPLPSVR
jgi:hypothetical protein